ncbi:hypothetical protein B0H11DRAFT_1898523 [Mycena galericulata]|nr:hypothetical protein B0H11DRAFT_1898523 [Mycena galericulata]
MNGEDHVGCISAARMEYPASNRLCQQTPQKIKVVRPLRKGLGRTTASVYGVPTEFSLRNSPNYVLFPSKGSKKTYNAFVDSERHVDAKTKTGPGQERLDSNTSDAIIDAERMADLGYSRFLMRGLFNGERAVDGSGVVKLKKRRKWVKKLLCF